MRYSWVDKHIEIDPPKRPKKITGTRFAAIMGLNKWCTPFATWCEITKAYVEPFEETIYTKAGKVIEPKQAEYMRSAYYMTNLVTPTDIYGEDYFKTTFGDFFRDQVALGGMWDYLLVGKDGNPVAVLEMKTTKRSEDWSDDVPEHYAMQAALYAYLLGVDQVYMVCSFLSGKDYETPEDFKPSADNTIVRPFLVSERYKNMEELVDFAYSFWENNVLTGISPDYDEKADKKVLDALRSVSYNPESDIADIVSRAENLKVVIDAKNAELADREKDYKNLLDQIKTASLGQFSPFSNEVVIEGDKFKFTVSRSTTEKVDKKALENDGLLDKYVTKTESYKLTVK